MGLVTKYIDTSKLLPSKEDIAMRSDDRISLAYWFPKLLKLGIKVPITEVIRTDADFWPIFDGQPSESANAFIEDLKKRATEWGYPLFLRTGHTSAKHSWKDSCHVINEDGLVSAVYHLAEVSAMAMPSMPWDVWVIREFLSLDIHFTAFWGHMPIATERRFFIEDGKVICEHPYWPAEAFERTTMKPVDWVVALSRMNAIEVPHSVIEESEKVSEHFDGAWSLDWARHKDGSWYAIDMAPAKVSYHLPGCKRAGD
ncbi:hypothetical protein LCGC14_3160340 [marine sediment metagenome]|uniref:ATP-grasp domain-containing protein n=1 Tax=marine sediment metagenome TaxID=412755 RepID=A0A0F8VRF7_9ZZZZ